ncbi:Serine/threonine-protein kinase sepA [Smittium culicis]|uniref:Serine/threonine-protein kinase sepA n=1 Tax=Smittium culicis TaxID=133412 RepID=A0A1R1Y5T3_9FUNG|nr:Serine/threonine-protein kinase sepA [Smittium culicis]
MLHSYTIEPQINLDLISKNDYPKVCSLISSLLNIDVPSSQLEEFLSSPSVLSDLLDAFNHLNQKEGPSHDPSIYSNPTNFEYLKQTYLELGLLDSLPQNSSSIFHNKSSLKKIISSLLKISKRHDPHFKNDSSINSSKTFSAFSSSLYHSNSINSLSKNNKNEFDQFKQYLLKKSASKSNPKIWSSNINRETPDNSTSSDTLDKTIPFKPLDNTTSSETLDNTIDSDSKFDSLHYSLKSLRLNDIESSTDTYSSPYLKRAISTSKNTSSTALNLAIYPQSNDSDPYDFSPPKFDSSFGRNSTKVARKSNHIPSSPYLTPNKKSLNDSSLTRIWWKSDIFKENQNITPKSVTTTTTNTVKSKYLKNDNDFTSSYNNNFPKNITKLTTPQNYIISNDSDFDSLSNQVSNLQIASNSTNIDHITNNKSNKRDHSKLPLLERKLNFGLNHSSNFSSNSTSLSEIQSSQSKPRSRSQLYFPPTSTNNKPHNSSSPNIPNLDVAQNDLSRQTPAPLSCPDFSIASEFADIRCDSTNLKKPTISKSPILVSSPNNSISSSKLSKQLSIFRFDPEKNRLTINLGNSKQEVQYQLGNCIGKGQFGSVYRALNLENGQMVAVKQIPIYKQDDSKLDEILHEVETLKGLTNPRIVRYYDFVKTDEFLFLVMEYVENGSLAATLKSFGVFPEKLVLAYVFKIIEGLVYLHSRNVVHCDLKAANILTTKKGNIKLADFGVSLNLGLKHSNDDSMIVAGTPCWMAPEIIKLEGPTTASDIWSLGCTIVELLSGKPPYADLVSMAALYHIVEDERPPFPENISAQLHDFLTICFEKDPKNRPTASQLVNHPWLKQYDTSKKEMKNLRRNYSMRMSRVIKKENMAVSGSQLNLMFLRAVRELNPESPEIANFSQSKSKLSSLGFDLPDTIQELDNSNDPLIENSYNANYNEDSAANSSQDFLKSLDIHNDELDTPKVFSNTPEIISSPPFSPTKGCLKIHKLESQSTTVTGPNPKPHNMRIIISGDSSKICFVCKEVINGFCLGCIGKPHLFFIFLLYAFLLFILCSFFFLVCKSACHKGCDKNYDMCTPVTTARVMVPPDRKSSKRFREKLVKISLKSSDSSSKNVSPMYTPTISQNSNLSLSNQQLLQSSSFDDNSSSSADTVQLKHSEYFSLNSNKSSIRTKSPDAYPSLNLSSNNLTNSQATKRASESNDNSLSNRSLSGPRRKKLPKIPLVIKNNSQNSSSSFNTINKSIGSTNQFAKPQVEKSQVKSSINSDSDSHLPNVSSPYTSIKSNSQLIRTSSNPDNIKNGLNSIPNLTTTLVNDSISSSKANTLSPIQLINEISTPKKFGVFIDYNSKFKRSRIPSPITNYNKLYNSLYSSPQDKCASFNQCLSPTSIMNGKRETTNLNSSNSKFEKVKFRTNGSLRSNNRPSTNFYVKQRPFSEFYSASQNMHSRNSDINMRNLADITINSPKYYGNGRISSRSMINMSSNIQPPHAQFHKYSRSQKHLSSYNIGSKNNLAIGQNNINKPRSQSCSSPSISMLRTDILHSDIVFNQDILFDPVSLMPFNKRSSLIAYYNANKGHSEHKSYNNGGSYKNSSAVKLQKPKGAMDYNSKNMISAKKPIKKSSSTSNLISASGSSGGLDKLKMKVGSRIFNSAGTRQKNTNSNSYAKQKKSTECTLM